MRIPWPRARQLAREVAKPLDTSRVPLAEAAGAALAAALRTSVAQPLCDTAAMDGYAVAGPGPWRLTDRILAGEPVDTRLSPGQATEIATGAAVPAGATAVLPYEHAARDGDRVAGPTLPRPHIRRRGEDFPAGQVLVADGAVVTPPVLGLAAAIGHDELLVHRRPGVAVLVTGDELLFSGPPRAGRVRDAIGPMLPGLVDMAGGRLSGLTRLPDDPTALAGALAGALDRADDAVVAVCGATSVGAADHLRPVLRDLGAEIVVDGVACRPGHPQLLAVRPDGGFLVGLPGNPYAALVAVLTLLGPLLGTLAGRAVPASSSAPLAGPVTPHPRDTLLLAACRCDSAVRPVGHDRPGSLWAPAIADVLAVVPPDWSGEDVELLPLNGSWAT